MCLHKFVAKFMLRLRTKLHLLSSNGSLVIAIKPKAGHRFITGTTLYFKCCIKVTLTNTVIFQIITAL